MKPRAFLKKLHHDKIVEAIREAEKKTSGEIRVFISRKPAKDPVATAQSHFLAMGMDKTREHNAILIFVAPRAHTFAVIGDLGVHARCGNDFWKELADEMSGQLADEMSGHFRNSDFTMGIIHGVHKAGELLARHFPRKPGDKNELPDEVESD
jgi:uncharacterized membrane protein